MSRLITFGCSNTYGQGLPDCHMIDREGQCRPGPHPSKHAWPSKLGKLLNASEVINLARPGASNKEIWHRVLNFDFKPDDFVVCHWSLIHRNCIIYEDQKTLGLGLWPLPEKHIGESYQKYLAETNSDHNLMIESCGYIDHTHLYLRNRVKHLYHVVFNKDEFKNKPDWCSFDFITDAGYFNRSFPLALDNAHTGVQGHKELAKDIFSKHVLKAAK